MREHRHHATDATVETLRRLRRAWLGVHVAADALHVALADGETVAIHADAIDVEPDLQAVRLRADVVREAPERRDGPGGFAAGGNDVVIFRSATWIEASVDASRDGAPHALVQFTGSPLQRTEHAVAACTVDDAVVVAATDGTGMLVRCGLRAGTLDVVTDRGAIARFLTERHYAGGQSDG